MYMAEKDDDDPDRVRPPHRGNDERRIGQEKTCKKKERTCMKMRNQKCRQK